MARTSRSDPSRRRVLTAAAGLAAGALGSGLFARPAAAAEPDLSSWFENTDGATGVVDRRGQSRVEIAVGASGNGGAFAFDPVAVRIDPGTTVVWRWTGDGGTHNVVAADGSFESDLSGKSGHTFEFTPDSTGVVRYACTPHKSLGMKGALVVGDGAVSLGSSSSATATATPTADATATPEASPARTFGGWLDGTDNYDGLVDRRGESTVTVKVGAPGNGGDFAFDPPAVHVDPGTTVVWKWVGDKRYDVADPELGYHSDRVAGPGHRFAVAFDGDGLSTYECTAYGDKGMRGVVLVGDGPVSVLSSTGAAAVGVGGTLASLPMLYGLREHVRDTTGNAADGSSGPS